MFLSTVFVASTNVSGPKGIDSRRMSTVWTWLWIKARDMHDFVHKGEGVSEQG